MASFVALIRAIGPVTHAKMKMAALRDACAAAGLDDVETVGNTGNILLASELPPDDVRALVQSVVAGFGLDNEVFLRDPGEMAEVVAANPFPDAARDRPAELGVCSFHTTPNWTPITRDYRGPEQVATLGTHLVVAYPQGITGSSLRIEKRLGVTMTMRNWTVFARLAEKVAARAER
jgi:uncharacterized protein (DUF1697 family)